MLKLRLVILLAALVAAFAGLRPAAAQAGPTVTDLGVTNRFPDGMAFAVSAQSDSEIEAIRLRYTILPDGTAARGVPDFDPATSVSTEFSLAGPDDPGLYLPPGTIVEYYWEVTDADGDSARTETATFFYDDIRFDWQSLEAGGTTLYFYSGSQDDAQAMLEVASEAIASVSSLLAAAVDFPVNVWTYASVEDMRPALQYRSETYEQSVITAGVRVASDTVLVLGNVSFDTLRHELAHIVTAVAGEGPFGNLPAWLNEGTAVYAESSPGGFGDAIQRAIERGSVLSVRSISSPAGDPEKVNLFYGQSWSLVSYLVDTYGQEQFALLFATIKSGKTTDQALEAVYGFDQDGLEDEWRLAHDLPPRVTPPPPPQEQPTDAPPTIVSSESEEEDGGASVALVVGLIVGTLALAGVVALAGLTLARRLR